MMNEKKTDFEFIERTSSSNKHPQGSHQSSRQVKVWFLFEGKEEPEKVELKEGDFKDWEEFLKADLDDFKKVLRKCYSFLENVENKRIILFNESLERLKPNTSLSSLDVDTNIIIVRYPLSHLSSK